MTALSQTMASKTPVVLPQKHDEPKAGTIDDKRSEASYIPAYLYSSLSCHYLRVAQIYFHVRRKVSLLPTGQAKCRFLCPSAQQ